MFIPYEELKITVLSANEYRLETPWHGLQIAVEASAATHAVLVAYSENRLQAADLGHISNFLKSLNLPFHYILPHESVQACDTHTLTAAAKFSYQTKSDFRKALGLTASAADWSWDTEAILNFAKLSEHKFSPASILSVVRRFHLLDCADQDRTSDLYDNCQAGMLSTSHDIRKILATIVYQNYYVTAKCQESLEPATALAQSATDFLTDFMRDEEGHDLLMMRAVSSLDNSPKDLYLAESTQNIMRLLKVSGQMNFLAFGLAVDFFEKPNFGTTDPLAELLLFHGQTVAADCLQKHKDINDGGEHDAMALDLLSSMKPVTKDFALFAIHLAEILTDEMTAVTAELLTYFLTNENKKQAL